MIIDLIKDFNINELEKFIRDEPTRYRVLCNIIGEIALIVNNVYLSITLPFNKDKGCITIYSKDNQFVNVLDTRYF